MIVNKDYLNTHQLNFLKEYKQNDTKNWELIWPNGTGKTFLASYISIDHIKSNKNSVLVVTNEADYWELILNKYKEINYIKVNLIKILELETAVQPGENIWPDNSIILLDPILLEVNRIFDEILVNEWGLLIIDVSDKNEYIKNVVENIYSLNKLILSVNNVFKTNIDVTKKYLKNNQKLRNHHTKNIDYYLYEEEKTINKSIKELITVISKISTKNKNIIEEIKNHFESSYYALENYLEDNIIDKMPSFKELNINIDKLKMSLNERRKEFDLLQLNYAVLNQDHGFIEIHRNYYNKLKKYINEKEKKYENKTIILYQSLVTIDEIINQIENDETYNIEDKINEKKEIKIKLDEINQIIDKLQMQITKMKTHKSFLEEKLYNNIQNVINIIEGITLDSKFEVLNDFINDKLNNNIICITTIDEFTTDYLYANTMIDKNFKILINKKNIDVLESKKIYGRETKVIICKKDYLSVIDFNKINILISYDFAISPSILNRYKRESKNPDEIYYLQQR